MVASGDNKSVPAIPMYLPQMYYTTQSRPMGKKAVSHCGRRNVSPVEPVPVKLVPAKAGNGNLVLSALGSNLRACCPGTIFRSAAILAAPLEHSERTACHPGQVEGLLRKDEAPQANSIPRGY